jgi:arylsulfatase A-like enzyme
VAPTIIHLFGLEPEDRFEGQSLLPIEAIQERGVFGEATDKHGSSEQTDDKEVHYYREGDIKIIYYERTDTWEIYDLRQDPKELNDIISNFPAVAGPLKEKILPRVARWNR